MTGPVFSSMTRMPMIVEKGLVPLVEKIDSSKMTELVVTDVGALTLPRMVIEFKERGPDMFRETLIREIFGTLDSNFFPGWIGFGAMKLVQNTPLHRWLNPKGVDHRRWIQYSHLEAFGDVLKRHIQHPGHANPQAVLKGFSNEVLGGLESTDGLSRLPNFRRFSQSPVAGRLVPQVKAEMTELLVDKPLTQRWVKALQQKAYIGELSPELRLLDKSGKKVLLEGLERDTVMGELKTFVNQYAKPLFSTEGVLSPVMRNQAVKRLIGGGNRAGLLPLKAQGVIPYAQRSKIFLSLLPLAVAITVSCSVSWMNRYITQKKFGGEVFFPGERVFQQQGLPATSGPQPRAGHVAFGSGMPILNAFDFAQPGWTTTPMNMAVYGGNILSRMAAARTANEFGEILRRDGLGWVFWFYTTPIIQRLVIGMAPKHIRKALLTQQPRPIGGALATLNWRINPLKRWHLTSGYQIRDMMSRKGFLPGNRAFLNELRFWRASATGVGLLAAFFMLGVGINLINIAITKRNIQKQQQS